MADKLIQKPKLNPKASKFTLKIKRSRIHRYGVFTMEDAQQTLLLKRLLL